MFFFFVLLFFFFQAEDGIRDFCLSRGLGDVYKRQGEALGPAHLEQVRRQCAKMLAGPPPRFTLAENFLEDYTAGVASQTLEALECALETEL